MASKGSLKGFTTYVSSMLTLPANSVHLKEPAGRAMTSSAQACVRVCVLAWVREREGGRHETKGVRERRGRESERERE